MDISSWVPVLAPWNPDRIELQVNERVEASQVGRGRPAAQPRPPPLFPSQHLKGMSVIGPLRGRFQRGKHKCSQDTVGEIMSDKGT